MFITLIGRALFLEAVVWGLTAAVMFWAYLAVSLASPRLLIRVAASASSQAVWLVPAYLLLKAHSLPYVLLGFALTANATRLVVSRWPPEIYSRASRPPRKGRHGRSFGAAPARGPVFAALLLQLGLCCALGSDYLTAAAALTVLGAAICTWCAVEREAYQPRNSTAVLSLFVSLALTLVLIPEPPAAARPSARPPGFLEAGLQALRGAATQAPAPRPEAKKQIVTSLAAPRRIGSVGVDGYPGAVLVPEKTLGNAFLQGMLAVSSAPVRLSRALVIPFTGEYQLFPRSYGRLPRGWVSYAGSPLDGSYETVLGTPMETDAYQILSPSINLSNCAKVRVLVSSGETSPVSAELQLMESGRVYNLGTDFLGLNAAAEATLEYGTPMALRNRTVDAIRVIFLRYGVGREPARNAKVAIREFRLLPDGPRETERGRS